MQNIFKAEFPRTPPSLLLGEKMRIAKPNSIHRYLTQLYN